MICCSVVVMVRLRLLWVRCSMLDRVLCMCIWFSIGVLLFIVLCISVKCRLWWIVLW